MHTIVSAPCRSSWATIAGCTAYLILEHFHQTTDTESLLKECVGVPNHGGDDGVLNFPVVQVRADFVDYLKSRFGPWLAREGMYHNRDSS
jgi:hypothetical protein